MHLNHKQQLIGTPVQDPQPCPHAAYTASPRQHGLLPCSYQLYLLLIPCWLAKQEVVSAAMLAWESVDC